MSALFDARRPVVTAALAAVALILTATASGSASASEGAIRGAGTPTAIEDSYIVVLKDSTSVRTEGIASSARGLAGEHGGRLGRVFQRSLRGFSVAMGERGAKRLAADPQVAYVEQNQVVRASDVQPSAPSWGIDRIDQRGLPLSSSYTYDMTASNVTAYILDTGILTTHATFGGRARSGIDTVDGDTDATDCNGHGTHVAGTVGGGTFGVAKAVELVGVRVLDCTGGGTTAGVIAGVDWVTANAVKPAVANMSLGGEASPALDHAVSASIASGVTYAIAAGNSFSDACEFSPARVPTAITVGATTQADKRSGYSNWGPCLDIYAPGTDITSAWSTGATASRTVSGTSMAAPHATGAAALILAGDPGATPAEVTTALTDAATTGVLPDQFDTGSPDRLLFTTAGAGGTPCPAATNSTNIVIPDDARTKAESRVTIAGCIGNASTAATVTVRIAHTFRGDLDIDLVAPDGSAYRLKEHSVSDDDTDVNETYFVNVSSETRDGTWRLRVNDAYAQDIGFIDSWTLTV